MTYTIITMSRGDEHRLREWVEYHCSLGFDDFHIILDNPTDSSEDLLKGLDVNAKITIDIRGPLDDYYDGLSTPDRWEKVKLWRAKNAEDLAAWGLPIVDSLSLRQYLYFPGVLNKYAGKGVGWLALIDVDEFLVLPDGQTIRDITESVSAPRIRFLNFNFDTSGNDPQRGVLEQHTKRWAREDIEAYGKGWQHRVKTVVHYSACLPLTSVHSVSPGAFVVLDPAVGRLHHYKATDQGLEGVPYSITDRSAADFFRRAVRAG